MGKQGDQRQIAVAQRRPNPPVRVSGSLPLMPVTPCVRPGSEHRPPGSN